MSKRKLDDAKGKKGEKNTAIEHRLWWQQWDDSEAMRFCTVLNPYSSDYEKIITAAADFTNGRVWPVNFVSDCGPKYIWEKFQHYLGVGVQVKVEAFFNDPEKSIKIFMSSYSRSKGYIWAFANLDCIPRVLFYFVDFLLRSKVLPQIENQLRRSLEVIRLALIEIPNTSNIAKTFPDKFSLACKACWGQKSDCYVVDGNTWEEPEAKRQKCAAPVEPEKETPAETTDAWSTGSDWGAAAEGWGQERVIEEDSGWGALPLEVDKPDTLLSLLGPTVLPLTHSSGIVERSMRRIISITRPTPLVAKSPPLPDEIYEPSADAVEIELDRHFAKVVLAPMIDWDGGESPVYTKPAILPTSRGAVVVVQDGYTPSPLGVQGSPQPHNPESDEITVLINDVASQVDYLREGMAIGGTWVQLVRQGGLGEVVAKKGGGGESKKSSYWYLDELALIVPSFWTIDPPL